MLVLFHMLTLTTLNLGHASCLMCKENITRYANSNHPKSRACRLPDVQGNLTKRPKEEKVFYWLTIANVIAHFHTCGEGP